MTLGEIIKEYRLKNNLSMDAFANKSGISKAYISLLEKNKHPKTGKPISPSVHCIEQAASAMNVDFNILFSQINEDKLLQLPAQNNIAPIEPSELEWRYPSVSNRLGTILKKYREETNLSAHAFAKELGIDENTYTDIESGKYDKSYMLPIELIQQISDVTGYDIDYILGASDHTILPTNEVIRINGIAHPISHIESDFHFKAKFEELCLENGIHAGNSEANIGITKEQFLAIQLERMPTLSELLRISYAFGVSMDYLIGKTDIRMSTLDADELELILDYRDCSPRYKENIKKRAHDLSISTIRESEESVAADEPLGNTGTDMGK